NSKVGYAFMLPFLAFFAVFTLLPVAVSFGMSLTDYNVMETPGFVNFENYRSLILDDDEFIIALKNTFVFAGISGPFSFFASFVLAWIINRLSQKMRSIYALALYIPSITSGVAMSCVWLYFFSNDSYGLINNVLYRLGFLSEPIKWTMDSRYILGVVIFISVWMGMGNGFLAFMAGMQNLSPELSEAGMVDGISTSFQELIYIILPQLKPQLLFGAVNSIVSAFSVFDIATAVAGMPSPNYAAHTIVAHLYDYAFIRFEMGYASAIAVVLFLITFLLNRIVMRIFASKD
ncbi:MAG: sugar ABC transporter permease, partial [Clostridia bacterium]|nr:sugar ABC transporter permease [Clostridia bacterium]